MFPSYSIMGIIPSPLPKLKVQAIGQFQHLIIILMAILTFTLEPTAIRPTNYTKIMAMVVLRMLPMKQMPPITGLPTALLPEILTTMGSLTFTLAAMETCIAVC